MPRIDPAQINFEGGVRNKEPLGSVTESALNNGKKNPL